MPTVVEELAAKSNDAPALLSERECMTYRQLFNRSNQYARWALEVNIAKGDVVALLMSNRPEYVATWLGITSVGGVVALLNTNLTGSSLAHCLNVAAPKHLIVAGEHLERLNTALAEVTGTPTIWTYGVDHDFFRRIDLDLDKRSGETLSREERRPLTIEDRALYVYTSGTTGLPKAANISHGRIMQWSHWFAGMMEMEPADRMYDCLPMYHSVGGVQVPGAALVSGASLVIREKFSASAFWSDIAHWDCTMFQYIGELCRYLLNAPASPHETGHRIRLACGNGLAAEIWDSIKNRFSIPRILEFYASTEGAVSLFNVEGKRGAIGRVPPYLAHRFAPALVHFDIETGEPVRDEHGFCIRCAPNEAGEALSRASNDRSNIGNRFEGYTDEKASAGKLLRNVFDQGDTWVRTGDLMRKDERGFYYFVDRIGDTFRRKGENVATSEVSQAICSFPGIKHAYVYGVAIPTTEGKVGMATLVVQEELNLAGFRNYLMSRLPSYARPLFLRIRNDADVTGTFKYSNIESIRQGYDPVATTDFIYFDDVESESFVRLDRKRYDLIQTGRIRV